MLGLFSLACATGTLGRGGWARMQVETAPGHARAQIVGTVTDMDSGRAVRRAFIVLSCTCLEDSRSTLSNPNGV